MSTPNLKDPFGIFLLACIKDYRSTQNGGPISDRMWQEKFEEWHEAWHAARKPKRKAKGGITAPAAEAIYQLYPRKVGKQAALKAILKALKSLPSEVLSERVRAYAAATARWPKKDKEFIPHPSTWFNDGRYEDDQNEWHRTGEKAPPLPPSAVEPDPVGWLEWMRNNRPDWRRFREEREGHPLPAWNNLPKDDRTMIISQMSKQP